MIGATRATRSLSNYLWPSRPSYDINTTDYTFWDKARRGKARGLELSGLFLKPLASKGAAWTLGIPPTIKYDHKKTEDGINDWWRKNHPEILLSYEEALGLGDSYVVVNPDLSVTIVPPHVVTPIVNEDDYSEVIGWKIVQRFQHPEETAQYMTVIDEYYPDRRIRIWQTSDSERTERFSNPLGVVPVIHMPNRFSSDELFGRPEGEALLNALQDYGRIFDAAINGNIRQGRPTPVISSMGNQQQVEAFWARYGREEEYEDPVTGETKTVTVIDFDPDQLLTLGGDAAFKYEAPGSFSKDTETLLALIFYLVLQNTEIPEFVWGNAISSSKASAQAQLEPFIRWIEKKRGAANQWVRELTNVVARYLAILEPGMRFNESGDFSIQWQPISKQDGQLTLNTVTWALETGLIDKKTALELAPVHISDIDEVLEKAEEEQEEKRQQQEDEMENAISRLATQQGVSNVSQDDEDAQEEDE